MICASHIRFRLENRSTLTMSRTVKSFVILLSAWAPTAARAQIGRVFVSAEGYVGLARVVYIGKIIELKLVEFDKPLTSVQKFGKPYRLVFEVSETVRGDAVKRLELVLSLQSIHYLEYMREQSVEIMLVGGPNRLDTFPSPEVGIEEQGKRVDGDWYQFRPLDEIKVPASGIGAVIASQLNTSYDFGRMFTDKLEVIAGRETILGRVRAFAKKKYQNTHFLHILGFQTNLAHFAEVRTLPVIFCFRYVLIQERLLSH